MSDESRENLERQINEAANTGRFNDAAELAVKLADLYTNDGPLQRSASSFLLQINNYYDSRKYALAATVCCPDEGEYYTNAGVVLNQCLEFPAAIRYLLIARRFDDLNPEIYHQLSYAVEKLGDMKMAAKLSMFAFQNDPNSQFRGVALAYAYAKIGDFKQAALALDEVIERFGPSGSVLRAQSGFLLEAGYTERALDAIDAAVSLEPGTAEYYLHRTTVLYELKRFDERTDAIRKALDIAPDDRQVRRHAVSVFVDNGELNEALKRAAELLSEYPEDNEYVSCMRFLLDTRDAHELSNEIGDIATLKGSSPPRTMRPPPSFVSSAYLQIDIIGALILREIRTRYGESRIAFLWTLIEPLLHIGTLAVVFQFTMHGTPPLGKDYFHFYFTGVMPYLLFSHLIMHVGHAIKAERYMMQMPSITPTDIIVAKAIVELFITAVVYAVFTILFVIFGVDAMPANVLGVIEAFAITFFMGLGLGALCASLQELGSVVEHIIGLIVRLFYFASGIFYIPGMMPIAVRDAITWNPFLHVVDMNRIGYYPTYAPHWYAPSYAIIFSIFAITIGLMSIALMSRTMRSHL